MSYCRTSSPGSDVYIFGTDTHLECHMAWKVAEALDENQYFTVAYDTGIAHIVMLGYCHWLIDQGVRVPGHAIRRLLENISKYNEAFLYMEKQNKVPSSN